MTHERFSNLSLLNIEKDLKNQLKTEYIINTFATEDMQENCFNIDSYWFIINHVY